MRVSLNMLVVARRPRVRSGRCRTRTEESRIDRALGLAQKKEGQFARVIIAPHRAFAVGHFLAASDVVPASGPVINGVENQALMMRSGREVRLVEEDAGEC